MILMINPDGMIGPAAMDAGKVDAMNRAAVRGAMTVPGRTGHAGNRVSRQKNFRYRFHFFRSKNGWPRSFDRYTIPDGHFL